MLESEHVTRATASSTRPLTQKRTHAGHSHSHQHDNVYLTSTNKKDAGVRITRIGLFVNLGMAIGKGVGGYLFHSQALIADAFHALTDLVSDFMTLATVSWSLRPPTTRFPNGYGKIESLGALGVSSLLLFGGIGMGANALDVLYTQFFMDALHDTHRHGPFSFLGHDHSHGATLPDLNAAWLAGGSIIVKEWLYRATMKIAKERKSAVLASNAVHHRIDSLTSIVALLSIGGAHVFTEASWLDPVGGLLISIMVIKAGWSNTAASLLELADKSVDDEVKKAVRRATTKAVEGVAGGDQVEVREIQGIKSGQNCLMDIELAIPGDWTVERTRAMEEAVRESAGSKVRGVRRVRIRFLPATRDDLDFSEEFIGFDVSPRSSPEPEDRHDHEQKQERHVHQYGNSLSDVHGGEKTK
jgi:cation diffusion facilitator family transporter